MILPVFRQKINRPLIIQCGIYHHLYYTKTPISGYREVSGHRGTTLTFKMFPNILAEVGTDDQRFTFQAGWTGYIRKTTFQYLASQNPWLWAPSSLLNTWIEERFAGFKGSVGDHFTYSGKVAFNKLN